MIQMSFFKPEEFRCKCGCGLGVMHPDFLSRLDTARRLAGVPFHINSGYRCARHNQAVGGVSDSSHVRGLAVDIGIIDQVSRFKIFRALADAGFTRIGMGLSLIHVDSDPLKAPVALWIYPNK